MGIKYRVLTVSSIFLTSIFFCNAEAAIIQNDAAITSSFLGTSKMLTLTQSIPDGQGLFAIDIESLTSSTYKFMSMGIAERYGLFEVALSTSFDSDFVVSNSPIASNYTFNGSNIQTFNFLNQSKYFGYWDDRNGDETPNSVDNYGWVKITRTISGLTASSSATAIGSGIVVGSLTQVPVPVPTALWLFGSGLIGIVSFSKKWKNG